MKEGESLTGAPGENFTGTRKLAARFYRRTRLTSKFLVVAYKKISPTDGLVMTAYLARRLPVWRRRVWMQ